MKEYLNIGSTPPEEDCIQVGQPGARMETKIYMRQLQREFPEGDFRVKGFEHDFGTYHEVVAYYDEGTKEKDAAFAAEGDCASAWDELAKAELVILRQYLQQQAAT